jgi:hypothetical protein
MTLKDCLNEVCPHCGSGSEYVVQYVQEHDKDPIALYQEALVLSEYQMGDLIGILLASDYDVFVPWYKKLLVHVNSPTSNDILDYYKEAFDEVEDLKI